MRLPRSLLAFVLVVSSAFAGCLGGDEAPEADAAAQAEAQRLAEEQAAMAAANATVDDGTKEANATIGEQPHIHDYWKGAERVTLMDEEMTSDPFTTLAFTFFNAFQGTPGVGGRFFELPEGSIVFEGTGQMEITASWSDPLVTGMALRYQAANAAGFSEPQPLTSGAPLVIPITPDMTDMPHGKTSRWAFFLSPAAAGQAMAGSYSIKIDVIKTRDPTMFPGHPDLFGDANTLTLFEGEGRSAQTSFAQDFVGIATQSQTDDSVISEKVVPMDTLSMTANLTVNSASTGVGQVSDVWVEYRSADSFRYRRAELLASDPATGVSTFGWPVSMEQTDSPYAKTSAWHFRVRATTDPTGMGESQFRGISDVQVEYGLVVVAYDALLEGISPLQEDRRDDDDRDDGR